MDAEIDQALEADHETLNRLLSQVLAAFRSGGTVSDLMGAALSDMDRELERHLRFEEEALFPALRRSNADQPARAMEQLETAHQWMRDALAAVRAAVEANDLAAIHPLVEELQAFLHGHERDEDEIYRRAKLRLTTTERQRILSRLKK